MRFLLVIATIIFLFAASDSPKGLVWASLGGLSAVCLSLLRRINRQEEKLAALERRLLDADEKRKAETGDVSPPLLGKAARLAREVSIRPGTVRSEVEEGFLFQEQAPASGPREHAAPLRSSAEHPAAGDFNTDGALHSLPRFLRTRHASQEERSGSGQMEFILDRIRDWLLGGNSVVKAGLVVLFFGVSFLLRYVVDKGLLSMEVRMTGAALLGVALLALGWRQRESRRTYAHLLQGGGVGILYLTVFASVRLLDFFSPLTGLVLMMALAGFSGVLAVMQNALNLAAFGATGGFLAPILMSTGQGNHVQLFSYYALLNAGVLAVAWLRGWRFLALFGFFFTFGIGTVWGVLEYSPEHFGTTEPFLIFFFVMYGVTSIFFARNDPSGERNRLNSALIFGLPLVTFSLQTRLVRDFEMGGAYSALALALWYLCTATFFRRGAWPRLLTEVHLALGVIFLSLAVPLAFDARYTASAWALEGAGMIWLGLRQERLLPRLFGLLLQFGAAVAFFRASPALPLDTAHLLPGLFLAAGGLFSHWAYERFAEAMQPQEKGAALLLGVGGTLGWYLSWAGWIAGFPGHEFTFIAALGLFLGSLAVWTFFCLRGGWSLPGYVMAFSPLPLFLSGLALAGAPLGPVGMDRVAAGPGLAVRGSVRSGAGPGAFYGGLAACRDADSGGCSARARNLLAGGPAGGDSGVDRLSERPWRHGPAVRGCPFSRPILASCPLARSLPVRRMLSDPDTWRVLATLLRRKWGPGVHAVSASDQPRRSVPDSGRGGRGALGAAKPPCPRF